MAKVVLQSLNVLEIFHEIRRTTGLFRVWKESGDDIVAQCPFHGGGNERKPSFGICSNPANPKYGQYHCFACQASGTIVSLINRLNNKEADDDYALDVIQTVSAFEVADEREKIQLLPRKVKDDEESVSPYEIQYYASNHCTYLDNRRIRREIQEAFDCGYDPVADTVTFPVKRVNGTCAFFVRRSVNLKWYNYPAGVKKPVYGIYELSKLAATAHTVVIVESVINALTLWGLQIPAVALLGTGSQEQISFLNTLNIRHWVLGMDGDTAGANATQKLKRLLSSDTQVMPIPPGKDINDLDEETIRILYSLRC